MLTRGSLNVFVVVTVLSGGVVGAAVPAAFFLYAAVISGTFDFAIMLGQLNTVALGGAIGFVLGSSTAFGASLLGVWMRGSRWGPLRLAQVSAPLVGAYVVQLWVPLVLSGWPWLYALILIPSATVAVTANVRWAGGFMNPRAVEVVAPDCLAPGESANRAAGTSRTWFARGWAKVALVCGSIVLATAWLVAVTAISPSVQSLEIDRCPSLTVIVGLGVIGVVVGFLWARPLPSVSEPTRSDSALDATSAAEPGAE